MNDADKLPLEELAKETLAIDAGMTPGPWIPNITILSRADYNAIAFYRSAAPRLARALLSECDRCCKPMAQCVDGWYCEECRDNGMAEAECGEDW